MALNPSIPSPSPEAVAAIAPTGVLRAGINLANTLLVTGRDDAGRPSGVSPSLASAISEALGVPLELVSFPGPGELVDALSADRLDIGNVGADPDRASEIDFTNPYCTIDATYLVRARSGFASVDDVDRPGCASSPGRRAAYTLWLERNIHNASLLQTETLDEAVEKFVADDLDALAGLRPACSWTSPGSRAGGSSTMGSHRSSRQWASITAVTAPAWPTSTRSSSRPSAREWSFR